MKHIKIFENYTDNELEDLMGNLSGVGIGKKWEVEGKIYLCIPSDDDTDEWEIPSVKPFTTEVYEETPEKAYESAFDNIKAGKFTQDIKSISNEILLTIPEIKEILSKENIIKLANEEASKKPSRNLDLAGRVRYDGKIRWLTRDLLKLLAEEIINYGKKFGYIGSQEGMDKIDEEMGFQIYIKEI